MKVVLLITGDKRQLLQLQLTSPNDPLVLYCLELSEEDFYKLKEEQSLLIDFQNFPSFLLKMLNLCVEDKNDFCAILQRGQEPKGLMVIQEKTQFRKLNHLVLNLVHANDAGIKNYLGALSKEFKEKYESTLSSLNQLKISYNDLSKENALLNEKIKKLNFEKETALENLMNDKNKEINELKENNFKESKSSLEKLEFDKNQKISDLESKVAELQSNLDALSKAKSELEDAKLKIEISQKDLEGKHAISSSELNVYKEDIVNLRKDNANLNQKCYDQEKEIIELRFKLENLSKQLEEKNKGAENLGQLVETLNKQRESNEDTIKSLKADKAKLEDKIQTSIAEINKGNEIIEKLTSEIKSQKTKNKGTKQALQSQEQLVTQKQILLDEQNKTISELKRDLETKDREITGLKNQLANYAAKLTENEKLIEDNKQMILYLNKNINENMSNPFKNRLNDMNMQRMGNTMADGYYNSNNLNLGGSKFGSKTFSVNSGMGLGGLTSPTNFMPNNLANDGQNGFLNEEQLNNSGTFNNLNTMNNIQENTQQNYMQNSNNILNSSQNSGMIMPETNFCGYKNNVNLNSNKKSSPGIGKYLMSKTGNGNMNLAQGNLLSHKYGNLNGNNKIQSPGDLGSNNTLTSGYEGGMNNPKTYNVEEEFPREMPKPQSLMIEH